MPITGIAWTSSTAAGALGLDDGRRALLRQRGLEIGVDDAAAGAAAGHGVQVEVELGGAAPHRGRRAGPLGRDHGRVGGVRGECRRGRGRGQRRRSGGHGCGSTRRRRRRCGRGCPCRCDCRGRRCRRCCGRRRPFRELDPDQVGADRQRLAHLAAQRQHRAGHRRRDLDAGLVGHHVGERLVLDHGIARLDMPGDELDLGDALADVGHLDDADAHQPASIARRIAAPTRSGPGK